MVHPVHQSEVQAERWLEEEEGRVGREIEMGEAEAEGDVKTETETEIPMLWWPFLDLECVEVPSRLSRH
jgi:hypothetical protein